LKRHGCFSESRTKQYVCEVILGIDALHSADIVYRDLKTENILLDLDGHIKLTDFGLSKTGVSVYGSVGGTRTVCGSREYFCPEMINRYGHGKAVDWWALGILTYEVL
jgi:serine/threonine protein kinase